MACKPIMCSVCNGHFPACQLKGGKCPACRAKETSVSSTPPSPKPHVVIDRRSQHIRGQQIRK